MAAALQTFLYRLQCVFILSCLTVLLYYYSVVEGFIRVTKYCPENLSSYGEIMILTDNSEMPFALCRGKEFNFIQICPGVFRLQFHHSGDPKETCLTTAQDPEHTDLTVYIPLSDELITVKTETRMIQCQTKFTQQFSDPLSLTGDLMADNNLSIQAFPSDLETNEAVQLSIQVKGINRSMNVAKLQIYSFVKKPRIGVAGVSPIKCQISNDSKSHILVDNGCSNGLILKIDSGFQVRGIVSWSPEFLYRIPNNGFVSVNCSFGVCQNNCDGSSCRKEKVEIIAIHHAFIKIPLTSQSLVVGSNDVELEVFPGISNPRDHESPAARPQLIHNIPLIISLVILLPIAIISLFAACWYKSRANSGAYKVRN